MSSLTILPDISNWDTDNVINMSYMFCKCSSLVSLPDISKWKTNKVTNMSNLFNNCSSLSFLPDISKWNTDNVINMSYIFSNCSSLSFLPDISKWNTVKVIDMSYMFNKCSLLSSLPNISKWSTDNVIDMSYMFNKCSKLLQLPDVTKWNTNKVSNMRYMFNECSSLTNLSAIPETDYKNVIILNFIFNNFYDKHIKLTNIKKLDEDDEIKDINLGNQENIFKKMQIGNINKEKKKEILKPCLTWKNIIKLNINSITLEYSNELWEVFIEKEKLNNYSDYSIKRTQSDINEVMRSILIDWIIYLHREKIFLKSRTLFLTVNLIDRYLSQKDFTRKYFQLLGVTALLLAIKYEEIFIIDLTKLAMLTANAFNEREIMSMEFKLIDLVEFDLDFPLSLDFFGLLSSLFEFNEKENRLGLFLLEAYLLSLNSCKYKQSQIGLAICYIILRLRKDQNMEQIGENNFLKYYSDIYKINFEIWFDYNIIIECAKLIYFFYIERDTINFREVYKLFPDLFN